MRFYINACPHSASKIDIKLLIWVFLYQSGTEFIDIKQLNFMFLYQYAPHTEVVIFLGTQLY